MITWCMHFGEVISLDDSVSLQMDNEVQFFDAVLYPIEVHIDGLGLEMFDNVGGYIWQIF
jgi:hypothetical protein